MTQSSASPIALAPADILYRILSGRMPQLDSFTRLGAHIGAYFDRTWSGHPEFEAVWLRVLGEEWSGFDNVGVFQPLLMRILPALGPVREMMSAKENRAYDALPEVLTVYRGCGPNNIDGMCWTMDRSIAECIIKDARYWQAEPLLITAEVARSDVLALKLDRKESEVLSFQARIMRRDRLLA
jgi:hypothetical protein